MASWEDIHDRDSLKAWLEARPREVVVAVAARAALRVMPIWADFCESQGEWARDLTPLPVLRAGLISSVAAVSPTDEIERAADAAHAPAGGGSTPLAADAARAALATAALAAGSDASDAARAALATAALAADAARGATAAAWDAVRSDAQEVDHGALIPTGPLWPDDNPLQDLWDATRTRWSEPDSPYAFWRRWYDSLLAGTAVPDGQGADGFGIFGRPPPLNPDLLYKIALIPNETWDARPEAVADAILKIEAEFEPSQGEVEKSVASMPPATPDRIQATKQAVERHRADLPPTLDAILGYISLEVKRLQERNYRDDDDEEIAKRQIRTLTTLYRAVENLQSLVPKTDEMPIQDAEKAEKLARLYLSKFKDWPRDHVDDVVGGVYAMGGEIAGNTIRMGLVAATAFALPMIGVPTPWALGAGIAVFGNKSIAEAAKTVRDSVFPSKP